MKMKNMFTTVAMAAALVFTSCSEAPVPTPADNTPALLKGEQNLKVDAAASKVAWEGSMSGLKIYSHTGTINIKEGNVTLKDGVVAGGNFVIDMGSIKTTDNNYGEQNTSEVLIGHLGSPDFFDLANHPTANFAIGSVSGNAGKGTLTLRGTQGEESITDIVTKVNGDVLELTGKVTFDRQKYGAAYKAAKDMLLADDIKLNIALVAKK
ncbi:MAG: YceI family protein [Flavobacteriales bacterium]